MTTTSSPWRQKRDGESASCLQLPHGTTGRATNALGWLFDGYHSDECVALCDIATSRQSVSAILFFVKSPFLKR